MPTYVQSLLTTGVVRIPALGMTLEKANPEPPIAKGSVARIHPRIDVNKEPARSQIRLLKNRGMIRLLSEEEYSALNAAPPPPAPQPSAAPEPVAVEDPVVDDAPTPEPDAADAEATSEEVPEENPPEETNEDEGSSDGDDEEYLKTPEDLRGLSKKKLVAYIREIGIGEDIDLRRTKDGILEQYADWFENQ